MIQRRPTNTQLLMPRMKIHQGQTDLPRFRYLVDIPECSAVVQNPQCHRNLQTSQASLLEKIVVENERNFNSSIFEENKEKMFDTKLVEEMRFSFSNHFAKEPFENSKELASKHEQSQFKGNMQSILAEKSHQSIRQPVLRNNHKESLNQSIQTIKNKYLNRRQKTESFAEVKEKKNINEESKAFKKQISNRQKSYYAQKQQNSVLRSNQQKSLEGVFKEIHINKKIGTNREAILSKSLISSQLPEILPSKEKHYNAIPQIITQQQGLLIQREYFQMLFNKLDVSKINILDRNNCAKQILQDQIKLILGPIWYKIQYCYHSIKIAQFVGLALKIFQLFPQQKKKQIIKQSSVKILGFQYHQQKRDTFRCQKCAQYYSQTDRQPLKSSPERLNHMPIRTKSPDRYYKSSLANFSLTKKAYVDLQETRYERERQELLANNPAKYSPSSYALKYGQAGDYESNKKLVHVSPMREVRQKMNVITKQVYHNEGRVQAQVKKALALKKKRNISQSMIRQHKQNLSELQKLNAKIEVYMTHHSQRLNNYQSVL